jgi:hypothetical protein
MNYESPRFIVHGSIESLTLQNPADPNGDDPCRFNNPRGNKQTGPADLIQGQAALATCTPTSA